MELSVEQRLSLDANWILSGSDNRLKAILEAGFALDWSDRMTEAFIRNEKNARPSTWPALGDALSMDYRNLTRYAAFHSNDPSKIKSTIKLPGTILRQRIAIAVGVDDDDLSPSTQEWISESAKWLIKLCGMRCELRAEAFLFFGQYVFAASAGDHGNELCDLGLSGILNEQVNCTREDAVAELLSVAQLVGEALGRLQESQF